MIGADRFIDNLSDHDQKLHTMQRYERGYSDFDMWNADCFIADVIVAACDWNIRNGQTSPWHLEKGDWTAILSEIREGFKSKNDDGVPNPPKSVWKLLSKYFHQLWD